MGCSHDCININLKTEEMAKNAIRLFGELLEEDLEKDLKSRFFHVDEMNMKETEDGFWFYIDEEPLFNNWDSGENINYFVKEFIKRYSDEYFYLSNTTTFNNCGDTTYCKYEYDEKNKELTIKTVYSEWGDGLYDCPECQEDFDGEALVYIEDYEDGKTYLCPNCHAEVTFDAEQYVEKIKLEDF